MIFPLHPAKVRDILKITEQTDLRKDGDGMADKKPDDELDFDAVLADLHRQARDKELEALANLTLLQSSFDPDAMSPEEQKRRDLDERLKKIISDLDMD